MNIKKLLLTGVLVLCASPFAFADEIGGGYTGNDDGTRTYSTTLSGDEIGGGTPTANDEIGGGAPTASGEIDAMLAWLNMMLLSI